MIREARTPYVYNSLFWTRHFRRNLGHMDHVAWEQDVDLSEEEKRVIGRSIATFQLGENSEGNSFRRAAIEYADQTGDYEYLTALDMFIKEENRHSAVLGRFMDRQGIAKITKEWTDTAFRRIRKLAGLNICISVLLAAEIIAAVYYRALGRATKSPVLRAICDQILVDEAHHLVFQAGTLSKQRRYWTPVGRWFFNQWQRILMAGTILIVWREHRQVYRAGGMTFWHMFRETWRVSESVLKSIQFGVTHRLLVPSDTKLPTPLDGVAKSSEHDFRNRVSDRDFVGRSSLPPLEY